MSGWRDEVEEALAAFVAVAALAKEPIGRDELMVEYLDAPHRPPSSLPRGKMAIYGFWRDGQWLKVGKAGPNSNARYTSQHYGPHAPSTLAKSLISVHGIQPLPGFDPTMPGEWIRQHTSRLNVLLPASRNIDLLALFEAFLHLRLKPRYEGFAAQRTRPNEDLA